MCPVSLFEVPNMPRKEENVTPLLALLRQMSDDERQKFAGLADTSVSYLYQFAAGARKSVSVAKALKIEDASAEMHRSTRGRLPKITARELAQMHALAGL